MVRGRRQQDTRFILLTKPHACWTALTAGPGPQAESREQSVRLRPRMRAEPLKIKIRIVTTLRLIDGVRHECAMNESIESVEMIISILRICTSHEIGPVIAFRVSFCRALRSHQLVLQSSPRPTKTSKATFMMTITSQMRMAKVLMIQ